jgi:hypothetical protein
MENTIPAGLTVVESPLPHAVNGVYVNEQYLTEQIDELWLAHQTYNGAIRSQKSEMRSLDATLSEMLYTMKAVLSRPGRSGGWSEFLRERRIPRASADRLVARYQRKLGEENCLTEAIAEPTEEDVQRFFSVVWPRLHKKLTTCESVYWFIANLVAASGAGHEFRDGGILVLNSPSETADGSSTAGAAAAPVPAEAATAVADPDGEVL